MGEILNLMSAVCFILSLKNLSSAATSIRGNLYGIIGMAFAVCVAFVGNNFSLSFIAIVIGGAIGIYVARKISMTQLPEMVACFHSLVGLSAVLIDCATFLSADSKGIDTITALEIALGTFIGAITFTGSLIAFLKLRGSYRGHAIPLYFNMGIAVVNALLIIAFCYSANSVSLSLLILFSLLLGLTLIVPVGGADMPVIVSMLNSYSGWAASGIGFTLSNDLLIITGAIVGASGAILSYIMCKGMNRSLIDVIFASGNNISASAQTKNKNRSFKSGAAEDAAFLLKNASSVIIVPGYGMATSQAQHALKEMGDLLKKNGTSVKYAIHPVAGRMPGHMNVLLAEANVPYEDVFELDDINSSFAACDVAYVVGANDVTNPAAKDDPSSSIYGMPILEVNKARTVIFLKRSMGTGYAGVENELFFAPNTMMLLGDAKKMTEEVVRAL